MGIGNWELVIGNWELGISNWELVNYPHSKRFVVRTLVLGKMRTKVLTTNQFSLLILQIDVEVAVSLVAYRLNFLGKRL
ncbi:MAG: hypothetical protein JGK24_12600 [Microcoleus sp. PH2017_29_MFU_D_A]|uniref:hypothetical protein n=1 Tax=unclassified Microcoleus TaxID=2642155 RepID=UPI001DCDB8A1|nr:MULTISPECIES: hypothetical protein [unclassified Microcoleus]MCC3432816.1 hypothetical protein [Microcoleus sp. PH2017_04_SCI_O_A]MCC3445029.1 hypothetical protein [Microcoleus sp. PH2017_03_ELD_O_A]MCC3504371.1 hypothetical protein [Microcoleus sp. PH2017_19_SFW_U_A]TAE44211.1 MAG: hypothetical protein EAZ90_07390 [Oscillatoriales cyanobacterium]MCC3414213.1 hypothetical protein [Microcoleus sp. PH2017_02_FOX_O_A]